MVLFAPYEKLDRRKKITKSLEKNAQFIDVSSPYPNEVNRYVKEIIKEKGYQMTDGAFQLFMERTDGQLTKMMHELSKLFYIMWIRKNNQRFHSIFSSKIFGTKCL